MVVLQHSTKPFTAFDSTHGRTIILIRLDQFIAQSLMVSLLVIVFDVFTNGLLK